jgi:hypothetical protein
MTTTDNVSRETYNGWTNYETWAVALWLDNESGSCDYWREQAQEAWNAAEATPGSQVLNKLKEYHEERAEELGLYKTERMGVFGDLLNAAMSEVDWHDIARHYIAEVDQDADAETT